MSRYKHYLENKNVLEAARQRVSHVFDIFDTVAVMFSGGKDSLVTLHLTWQETQRRGHKFLNVVFRDEELIPDCVIDFVDSYRKLPWVKMHWYCYPMMNEKFILGHRIDVVQWGPGRKWLRPMPSWGIRPPKKAQYQPVTQHEMDALIAAPFPGKVAFMVGIRASESLVRYRSVVNKLSENYICASSTAQVKLCKPIYDWEENDVLKFFFDERVPYCPIYRLQHLDQTPLRVATPLHAEAAKEFGKWRRMLPDFYGRLIEIFPDMQVQERYWREVDKAKQMAGYELTWEGCQQFIADKMSGDQQSMAEDRLTEFKSMARKQPDSYTPEALLKFFTSGNVERTTWGKRTQEPWKPTP